VTQADALSYAHWLGRDLTAEAEREYAGKGGRDDAKLDTASRDGQGKPTANYWQCIFPTCHAATDGYHGLAPVGCYAANPFYLYDMIGDAWEWSKDPYTGPRQSHANGGTAAALPASLRTAGRPDQKRVIKGDSLLGSPDYCVCATARRRARSRKPTSAPNTSAFGRCCAMDSAIGFHCDVLNVRRWGARFVSSQWVTRR
jgi:formylglycine-generating enzyme required for sulfatase activity